MVIPRLPNPVFWIGKQNVQFEIPNGHNWVAILSNRGEALSSDTSVIWSTFWEGVEGAMGLAFWERLKLVKLF